MTKIDLSHAVIEISTPLWFRASILGARASPMSVTEVPWLIARDDERPALNICNVGGRALRSVQLYAICDGLTFASLPLTVAANSEVRFDLVGIRDLLETGELDEIYLRWQSVGSKVSSPQNFLWPVVW